METNLQNSMENIDKKTITQNNRELKIEEYRKNFFKRLEEIIKKYS